MALPVSHWSVEGISSLRNGNKEAVGFKWWIVHFFLALFPWLSSRHIAQHFHFYIS